MALVKVRWRRSVSSGAAMPPSDPSNDNDRATLGDVASRAGVSRSTASNIMTGFRSDRYSTETQQRVRAAAAALNYRPNAAARALVRRSTGVLAMLAWTDVRDIVVGRYAAGVQ